MVKLILSHYGRCKVFSFTAAGEMKIPLGQQILEINSTLGFPFPVPFPSDILSSSSFWPVALSSSRLLLLLVIIALFGWATVAAASTLKHMAHSLSTTHVAPLTTHQPTSSSSRSTVDPSMFQPASSLNLVCTPFLQLACPTSSFTQPVLLQSGKCGDL